MKDGYEDLIVNNYHSENKDLPQNMKKHLSSYQTSTLLSRLTHSFQNKFITDGICYIFIYIYNIIGAKKGSLEMKDVPYMKEQESTSFLTPKLENNWKAEVEKAMQNNRSPNFRYSLQATFIKDYLFQSLLGVSIYIYIYIYLVD